MTNAEPQPPRAKPLSSTFLALAAAILSCQLFLGLLGADDAFTRGHNGFNSAAYLQAARNTLRWRELFPHQYHTAPRPPAPADAYVHAPLAAHLHNVVAVQWLGDRPLAVRAVAALHGLLVVAALLRVVSAHWSRVHALLAAGIYTVLPINAIYVNMVNHSAGFLFWSLLMLHSYLRFRARRQLRWYLALLASALLATAWDWPAYYVAFCVAVHWCLDLWRERRRGTSSSSPLGASLAPLAGYCAWISLTIAALVAAIYFATGGVGDLLQTLQSRQTPSGIDFGTSILLVPPLVFTAPVLLVCAGWLLHFGGRLRRGGAQPRDVFPLSFAVAGAAHYLLFRNSATVHEYWLWPLLPFVAIALADFIVVGLRVSTQRFRRASASSQRLSAAMLAALVLLPPTLLLTRSARLVPRARQVGGSLWFLENVRGDPASAFDSGRAELRFASKVRAWTDRTTGVLVHDSLKMFKLEPRFDVTVDRELQHVSGRPHAPQADGVQGWVFIGTTAQLSLQAVLRFAGPHALVLYDHYFMIDLRRRDRSTRVYRLAQREPSLRERLLESPFEPPVKELRDNAAELLLSRQRPL